MEIILRGRNYENWCEGTLIISAVKVLLYEPTSKTEEVRNYI